MDKSDFPLIMKHKNSRLLLKKIAGHVINFSDLINLNEWQTRQEANWFIDEIIAEIFTRIDEKFNGK